MSAVSPVQTALMGPGDTLSRRPASLQRAWSGVVKTDLAFKSIDHVLEEEKQWILSD